MEIKISIDPQVYELSLKYRSAVESFIMAVAKNPDYATVAACQDRMDAVVEFWREGRASHQYGVLEFVNECVLTSDYWEIPSACEDLDECLIEIMAGQNVARNCWDRIEERLKLVQVQNPWLCGGKKLELSPMKPRAKTMGSDYGYCAYVIFKGGNS